MNYETKFNIGDTVWLMHENRPVAAKVGKVVVIKMDDDPGGTEEVTSIAEGRWIERPAENLFPTKEALIASL